MVDGRNDDGRRAMRSVIATELFQEVELSPCGRLDLIKSLYTRFEAERLRRER